MILEEQIVQYINEDSDRRTDLKESFLESYKEIKVRTFRRPRIFPWGRGGVEEKRYSGKEKWTGHRKVGYGRPRQVRQRGAGTYCRRRNVKVSDGPVDIK